MSLTTAIETEVLDPLLYLAPLPYTARVYPYGFPVEIATDAREVLDAAAESWGMYEPRFDRPPIRIHVMVGEGAGSVPRAPVLRGQRNMVMWVSDHENFGVIDRRQRFGYSCVTRATLADRVFFRWHFLDALIYVLLELNYITSLHGASIAWGESGVMLYGESGVGKSTLSYACARRGWTYVSDDSSSVVWDGGRKVIGESHHFRFRAEAPQLFPELQGLTVGRELDRKPTIEVHTRQLPIRTAAECRVDRIVLLDRRPDNHGLTRVAQNEVGERLRQDMPAFDPELDEKRRQVVDEIAQLPAYNLRYSNFEDAVLLLEKMMRGESA